MADSKKYDGSTWEHSLRKLTTATEAVESPLYSDGTAITAYTIKGNTVQNGTPSPSNPVEVKGVGVRTENLAHNWFVNSTTSRYSSILFSAADLKSNTTYVIMFDVENVYNFYSNENVFTSLVYINTVAGTNYIVVTTKSNIDVSTSGQGLNGRWIILKNGREQSVSVAMTNVMIVEGSTPPTSFIPYGYKIPISSAGQTIDIYIGDLPLLKSLDSTAVDEISNGTLTRRVDSDGSVLPTPTTTQITMPSIPTTDGANSITVDTTVQPSEFTATWTGWHDATVKEWDGSDWQ